MAGDYLNNQFKLYIVSRDATRELSAIECQLGHEVVASNLAVRGLSGYAGIEVTSNGSRVEILLGNSDHRLGMYQGLVEDISHIAQELDVAPPVIETRDAPLDAIQARGMQAMDTLSQLRFPRQLF